MMTTANLLRWSETLGAMGAAWLLTYALHSTVLIGGTWALQRFGVLRSLRLRDLAWRGALVGGVLTASLQMAMGLAPWGFTLEATPPTTAPVVAPDSALAPPVASGLGRLMVMRSGASSAGTAAGSGALTAVVVDVPSPAAVDVAGPGAAQAVAAVSPHASVAIPTVRVGSLFFMAWVAVASALLLRLAVARARVLDSLGVRVPVLDAQVREQLEVLCGEAGREGPVQLTTADGLKSPVALGWAEICLPRAALETLDAPQQRSVLAHELAHLERQDPLWLLTGTALEQLLFFQPLNRLARRNMQEVAEYLCDDWAAMRDGSGLSIARGLASVAQWLDGETREVPLAGMAEHPSLLVARVQRLLDASVFSLEPRRPWHLMALALVLLLTVVVVPGVRAAPAVGWFEGEPSPVAGGPVSVRTATDRASAVAPRAPSGDAVQIREALDIARQQTPSPMYFAQLAPTAPEPAEPAEPSAPSASRMPHPSPHPHPHPHPNPHPMVNVSLGSFDVSQFKANWAKARSDDAHAKLKFASMSHGGHSGSGSADPATVDALVKALRDPDAGVREAAAQSLARLEDPRSVEGLMAATADSDGRVRLAAVIALLAFEDPRTIPALAKALKDSNPEMRQAAAEALSAMNDSPAVIEPLVSALADAKAEVRLAAVQGLAARKDKRALSALAVLVKDPSPEVRAAAISALGDLQDPASIPALTSALKDENEEVRMQAVRALANFGNPKVIPALIEATKDKNAEVRAQAAAGLAECNEGSGGAAVVTALKGLLDDASSDVREQAINALSEIRDAGSVQALIAAMQSKDPVVRKAAAAALGQRD